MYGHTQVNVEIEDVNDNAPEFESNIVRISVPENVEIGVALYAAHARDRDSGPNGVVQYKIVNNGATGGLFEIDPKLGHLTLTRHLDYETSQRHSLIIAATDTGIPPLSANLTVMVEVQDVNDNPPVFERSEYSLAVLESMPVNSQVRNQVTGIKNIKNFDIHIVGVVVFVFLLNSVLMLVETLQVSGIKVEARHCQNIIIQQQQQRLLRPLLEGK